MIQCRRLFHVFVIVCGPQEPIELIKNDSKKVFFKGVLLAETGHGRVGSFSLEEMDCKKILSFVKIVGFIVK